MDDDVLARLRAEADQAKEAGKEFAGSLWAFFSGLRTEGFTTKQAMTLTTAFLVAGIQRPPESSE